MTEIRIPKGLTEGLGGECLVPSGTVYQRTEEPLHPYFTGSITSASNVKGNTVTNANGLIQSISIDNATTLYGYQVKAGSVILGAASISGAVTFATPFTTANWFLVCSPSSYGARQFCVAGSPVSFGLSGAKASTGGWIVGGSNTVVDWIAVGI